MSNTQIYIFILCLLEFLDSSESEWSLATPLFLPVAVLISVHIFGILVFFWKLSINV